MFVQFDLFVCGGDSSGVASKNYKRGRKYKCESYRNKLDVASNALIGSFRNKPTPHIIFSNDRMDMHHKYFSIVKHN